MRIIMKLVNLTEYWRNCLLGIEYAANIFKNEISITKDFIAMTRKDLFQLRGGEIPKL